MQTLSLHQQKSTSKKEKVPPEKPESDGCLNL